MAKTYLFVILCYSLAFVTLSQGLCNNCVDPVTLRYVCSELKCTRFSYVNISSSYCPDADRFNGLECKSTPGSNRYCYFNDKYDNLTNTCYYTACNYSLPNCGSCSNNYSCSNCYGGFFKQDYDLDTDYQNCVQCKQNIPGCLKCSSATRCVLCQSQYILMQDGFCHNSDGTFVNGVDTSTGHIFIALIVIAVLFLIGIIMGGIAIKFAFFTKPRYHQPLLQN